MHRVWHFHKGLWLCWATGWLNTRYKSYIHYPNTGNGYFIYVNMCFPFKGEDYWMSYPNRKKALLSWDFREVVGCVRASVFVCVTAVALTWGAAQAGRFDWTGGCADALSLSELNLDDSLLMSVIHYYCKGNELQQDPAHDELWYDCLLLKGDGIDFLLNIRYF